MSVSKFTNIVAYAISPVQGDVGAYQVLETAEIFDFDQNNWQSTGMQPSCSLYSAGSVAVAKSHSTSPFRIFKFFRV